MRTEHSPCQDVCFPWLYRHLQVPVQKGGFILAALHQHLPFEGISKLKACTIFVRERWEWENTEHSCFAQCGEVE